MREINKIAEGLFEKIRDRFEDVSLGDEKAKTTQDPEKARFFNFDYVIDDVNLGNVTLSIIDEISLKVYFSKNISDDLDDEQRHDWYSFLKELRRFAKSNLLSFEPRDITRSTLKHRDIQQLSKADSTYSKDEVVSESLYGTRKSSYERRGPVRIIVRHSKAIEDAENHRARTHHINSIYLETQEGERFKLPVKSLRLGRALAQHLKHGGSMQDDLGRHICEMAVECAKLKPFINNTRHRVFEDEETQAMAEAAFEYHGLLNNTLKRMTGRKGYKKCAEQFVATSTSFIPEVDADEMKQRFEKRTFDDRLEEALPLVHKAYNMKKENRFAEQFVNWADTIAEGTWAVPNTDEDVDKLIDILSKPLPAGVDGENATNALYNIIGDDRLFDKIAEVAKIDPEKDVGDLVSSWLYEHLPHIYQQIENEIGDPDVPAEQPEVDEGNTYGSGDGGMDGVVYEERDIDDNEQVCVYCGEPRDDKFSCCDENHWVPKSEFDKDEVKEDKEECKYCGGDCPNDEEHACDGYLGDIDDLYKDEVKEAMNPDAKTVYKLFGKIAKHEDEGFEMLDSCPVWTQLWDATDGDVEAMLAKATPRQLAAMKNELTEVIQELFESKDKIKYDPKTGKLTGWEHEGDWEKTKGKDPVGKIHHLSDVARKRTEKLSKDEVKETYDGQDDDGGFEAIQSAIIRRIAHSHHELLMKLGPDGVLEAAREIAEYAAPVEEIGSSDISAWVHQIERDTDIEPEHSDLHEAFERALREDSADISDKLQSFVGQTFYIPKEGNKGTVSAIADPKRFSNSLVVDLANGTTITVHFTDLKPVAETPGPVTQLWQKLKAAITGGAIPKMQPKINAPVSDINTPQQFQKLAGVK